MNKKITAKLDMSVFDDDSINLDLKGGGEDLLLGLVSLMAEDQRVKTLIQQAHYTYSRILTEQIKSKSLKSNR